MLSKAYHQSPRATATARHKPDPAWTIAREVCALHAVVVSLLPCVCACSSKVQHPPELGNCQAEGDASCSPSLYGGGSSSPHQGVSSGDGSGPFPEAATGDASGPSQEAASGDSGDSGDDGDDGDDGGLCGTAHNGVATQNPACLPCILQQCCNADSICSLDPVCLSLVSTAFPGSGVPMCDSQSPPASCTKFLDFAMCIAGCTSCPSLTLRDF